MTDVGRSPLRGSGHSAKPEPSSTVSAADAASVPNAGPWAFDIEENDITCNGAPIFSVYRADDFPCIEDEDRPAADMDYLAHASVAVLVLNAIANSTEPTLGDTLRALATSLGQNNG